MTGKNNRFFYLKAALPAVLSVILLLSGACASKNTVTVTTDVTRTVSITETKTKTSDIVPAPSTSINITTLDPITTVLPPTYIPTESPEETVKKAAAMLFPLDGSEPDTDEALELLEPLAEIGISDAFYYLGYMYDYGFLTDDFVRAFYFYSKSDNPKAVYCLGWLYRNGQGVVRNINKSSECFSKAEEMGFYQMTDEELGPDGLMLIAGAYYSGIPTAIRYTKAIEYYKKAADFNNSNAMAMLGSMYSNGMGTEVDYKEAVKWYEKAAELGNAVAWNNLGMMYQTGQGVTKYYNGARDCYLKAAELGSSDAMCNLGYLYHMGLQTLDYKLAMKWYLKAAELGNTTAMTNIGTMYFDGKGVEKDPTAALNWYRKAAALGDETASEYIRTRYK